MSGNDGDGPLTPQELSTLRELLRRFASYDLDQWEEWKVATPHGPAYIVITREPEPGWATERFIPF